MRLMTAAALSLLAGSIAALFVWYAWSAAENLMALRRTKPEPGEALDQNGKE